MSAFYRTLKTWHKVAGEKVIALMHHDLVQAKSKWAAGIKELREMFIRVEQDGFSMQSQAVWRLHWDHQIYKVRTQKCPDTLQMLLGFQILPTRVGRRAEDRQNLASNC